MSQMSAVVFAALQEGVEVFPRIMLGDCAQCGSLPRLQKQEPIKTLTRVFVSCGLEPRLGYNPALETMSFTLSLTRLGEAAVDETTTSIVLLMLAVHPAQSEHEQQYAKWLQDQHGPAVELLCANTCLDFFTKQSGVAIIDRKLTGDMLRIVFCSARSSQARLGRCSRYRSCDGPFHYSPSYLSLPHDSSAVVSDMVDEFWSAVDAQHYFPSAGLKAQLTQMLTEYFTSGLMGETAGFHVRQHKVALYLWGEVGVGKSEFIKVFRPSLEVVLRKFADPLKRLATVVVPLNAMSGDSLKAVANVKGISDYSIERLCEQTLVKGDIVLLHFEENPEDPDLQQELFHVASTMLNRLLTRYPEFKSHVLYVFTANYPPADVIQKQVNAVLHIERVTPEVQREWCTRKLTDAAKGAVTGQHDVLLALDMVPPCVDMRRLRRWCVSVGAQIHALILAVSPEGEDALHVSVGGASDLLIVTLRHGNTTTSTELISHDQVFYYPCTTRSPPCLEGMARLSASDKARIAAVVEMVGLRFLSPAVIVLCGAQEARETYTEAILSALDTMPTGGEAHVMRVTLEAEEDKDKIFGSPSEIRGGVFKFVDTVQAKEEDLAVVVARANDTGQFALRDILDEGTSRTHFQALRKDRLVFILDVLGGEPHPAIPSRAHLIFECQ